MRPWVYEKLQENQKLIEARGPIASEEVDGSFESWLRYYHFRYTSPGMKEAMVLAAHAVLSNQPLPVSETRKVISVPILHE